MTYLIILMIFIYYSSSILLVIIYLTCFFFFLCCFLNCLLNLNYKYCFQFSVNAINPSTYQFYLLYLRLRNPILLISNLGLPVPLYLFIYSTNFCKIIVNISRKNLLIWFFMIILNLHKMIKIIFLLGFHLFINYSLLFLSWYSLIFIRIFIYLFIWELCNLLQHLVLILGYIFILLLNYLLGFNLLELMIL